MNFWIHPCIFGYIPTQEPFTLIYYSNSTKIAIYIRYISILILNLAWFYYVIWYRIERGLNFWIHPCISGYIPAFLDTSLHFRMHPCIRPPTLTYYINSTKIAIHIRYIAMLILNLAWFYYIIWYRFKEELNFWIHPCIFGYIPAQDPPQL